MQRRIGGDFDAKDRVATHQDGRKLRHNRRGWIIEHANSWQQNFRRLVARYEHKVKNFGRDSEFMMRMISVMKEELNHRFIYRIAL